MDLRERMKMKNIIKQPRKMFDIPTFKATVNMLIAREGFSEEERKMACIILENVLTRSGNKIKYDVRGSEYNRKYA